MLGKTSAVAQFLLADPGVSAIVGKRVYVEDIPDSAVATMPKPTVLVQSSGGSRSIGGRTNDFSDARVDVKCYAWKKASANDLEGDVFDALRRLTRVVVSGVLIHWCHPETSRRTYYEPTTPLAPSTPVDMSDAWPVALRSWQVMTADIPVPA